MIYYAPYERGCSTVTTAIIDVAAIFYGPVLTAPVGSLRNYAPSSSPPSSGAGSGSGSGAGSSSHANLILSTLPSVLESNIVGNDRQEHHDGDSGK